MLDIVQKTSTIHRQFSVSPGKSISLHSIDHPIAKIQPKTKLGAVAQELAAATAISTISVAATSAYVYALIEAASPAIQFKDPPPGTKISVQSLQDAYQTFQTQFATLQGQASVWINTDQTTGQSSIFSNLVSVPTTLSQLDPVVQSKFSILSALKSSNPLYKTTLSDLEALVGAEKAPVQSLVTQVEGLATTVQTSSSLIQTSTSTGVLKELQDAYASEIQALKDDIKSANDTIDSDNKKIIGLGFGAGAAILVGLIGLGMIWNPIGWIMIAGGAVGAYFAISEILALKAQIAVEEGKIKGFELWKTADATAAGTVSAFSTQLTDISTMTASVQEELTQLENLYTTLADDISEASKDLTDGNIADALKEWNTIVQEVAFLENITAYIWPNPIQLTKPSNLSAAGSSLYAIDNAAKVYKYTVGGNTWTELADTSLSISAKGSLVVGIEGAPVPNPSGKKPPNSTYVVTEYSNDKWNPISTHKYAQILTDGTSVYAINQAHKDRQIYQYSGSGKIWNKLTDFPDSDVAQLMQIANGNLYALGNNSNKLYNYTNSAWASVNSNTYTNMSGNGKYLALIRDSLQASVLDVETGVETNTCAKAQAIAQMTDGDQYVVGSDQNLYHFSASDYSKAVLIKNDIVDVVCSETDEVFCTDNKGDAYHLSNQTAVLLPTLPSHTS